MKALLKSISERLAQGEDLVLATILSHEGSTPRTAGSKMLIARDGTTVGTIGGGILEAQVMAAAPELFAPPWFQVRSFDFTGLSAQSVDMICGGRLEVLIECLSAGRGNLDLFERLAKARAGGKRCFMVTDLEAMAAAGGRSGRYLLVEGREPEASLPWAGAEIDALRREAGKARSPFLMTLGGNRLFVEPWSTPGTLLLIGAGHVSRQTAALASLVGFRTIVMDDREEFANAERFPAADEIRVLTSFEACLNSPDIDGDSYLVIVTRGHVHDKTVLAQALRTRAGYLGMIGSRSKRDAIYRDLEETGFAPEAFERVHCPIGLPIEAETPEEIAVSIVAELIKARADNMRQ